MAPKNFPSNNKQSDITYFKQLKRQDGFHALLLSYVPNAVVAADKNMRITYVNHAAEKMFGWAETEILGQSMIEILQIQFPDGSSEQAGKILTENESFEDEVIYRRKDGTYFDAYARSAAMYGPNKTFAGLVTVFIDLAVQKKTIGALSKTKEELEAVFQERTRDLKESENRFRAVVDSTPVIIWVTNSSGKMEFVNRAFSDFYGVTIEQVQTEGWLPLVHPEDVDKYAKTYRKSLREHKPFRAQIRVQDYDGNWCWIDSQGQPRFSVNGEFLGMAGSSQNISERKEVEAAVEADLNDTRLLHDLSAHLVSEDNVQVLYQEILFAAIHLTHADAGTVQILDQSTQELMLLATSGFDPIMTSRFSHVDASSHTPCGIAFSMGKRTFIDFNVPASEDPDGSMRMHVEAGYQSAQSTPLITRSGKPIGMISTHWCEHGHRPTERELRFFDLLARQAADLIERAQAEAEKQSAASRDAFRVQLTDALRPLADPVQIQAEACRLLGKFLDVDRVHYAEFAEDQDAFFIHAYYCREGYPSIVGQLSLRDFGEYLIKPLLAGRTLAITDISQVPDLTDSQRSAYAVLKVQSYVAVPMIRNGLILAALSIHLDRARNWTKDEVALIEEVAERTWATVERARAEDVLRKSEARFRSSIENLNEAFMILIAVRESGKIIDFRWEYINDATCRIYKRSLEEIKGHTILDLYPEQVEMGLIEKYIQVVETGQPLKEQTYYSNDGSAGPLIQGTFDIRASKFGDGVIVTANDITEQVRLETENQEAVKQREIHLRLAEQREMERQSYARDIHDGPIQTLSGLAFNLQFLKEIYPDPSLRFELDQIALSVKGAVQELRQVMNELRPPTVIRFGLSKAIQTHAENLRERYPQINWKLKLANDGQILPEQTCLAMFRIYQEAVNNIIRHSEATKAWVHFRLLASRASLEIRDNGKGFTEKQDIAHLTNNQHFGLAGIAERVEAIGGKLEIETKPGKGTTVRVTVPFTQKPAGEQR